MRKIIVPTDFSEDAAKAYNVAATVAKRLNAELCLFHIVPSQLEVIGGLTFGSPTVIEKDNVAEIRVAMEKLAELKKNPAFNGINVTIDIPQAKKGDPADLIIEYINKETHSLMIMGTAGAEQQGESNAEVIARNTTIPLMTVRSKQADFAPKKITIATDFKAISSKFVRMVEEYREVFGAELEFLYVNSPSYFKDTPYINKEWARIQKRYQIKNAKLIVYNAHDVTEGIISHIKSTKADMIALPTQGRTGIDHFLFGSFTEDIINELEVPVFTYNLGQFAKISAPRTGMAWSRGFTG